MTNPCSFIAVSIQTSPRRQWFKKLIFDNIQYSIKKKLPADGTLQPQGHGADSCGADDRWKASRRGITRLEVVRWNEMKSGVAGRSRDGEQCCQVLARVHGHLFQNHGHLRTFSRQNFHTYGLLSEYLTTTLN